MELDNTRTTDFWRNVKATVMIISVIGFWLAVLAAIIWH